MHRADEFSHAKALTIAIRYAAVRRQFSSDGSKLETQILDYPIHQRRLMPLLAQAVATGFTALRLEEMYRDMTASLETLEPSDVSVPLPPRLIRTPSDDTDPPPLRTAQLAGCA